MYMCDKAEDDGVRDGVQGQYMYSEHREELRDHTKAMSNVRAESEEEDVDAL